MDRRYQSKSGTKRNPVIWGVKWSWLHDHIFTTRHSVDSNNINAIVRDITFAREEVLI